MEDRQLVERLQPVLSALSAEIGVRQETLLCTEPGPAPNCADGLLTLPITGTRLRLFCPESTPGGSDLLRLASEAAQAFSRQSADFSERDALRSALMGRLPDFELEQLQDSLPFKDGQSRVVMVFSIPRIADSDAIQLLKELTPTQDADRLIRVDRHSAALIRVQDEDETADDMLQFGQALQETLLAETGLQMLTGVSSVFCGVRRLHSAFTEAQTAIDVGRRFKPNESVFVFTQLSVERFLLEASPESCRKYHELIFNPSTASLFNEEMMYTIDMFFRKDLNLSDTARQLYIHRNTLVYRLNKVQKQTGLDLRTFRDAVTFKLLMEMKKSSGEQEIN